MGGNATQPAATEYSRNWYVRELVIFRSEQGFAKSRFSMQIAFGQYVTETDPVTGNQLFDVWGTKRVTITGEELMELLSNPENGIPNEDQQATLTQIATSDATLSQTADNLLAMLKQLNLFDDTAVAR